MTQTTGKPLSSLLSFLPSSGLEDAATAVAVAKAPGVRMSGVAGAGVESAGVGEPPPLIGLGQPRR